MKIKELLFCKTCDASPEQYDVYNNYGDIVGYVRLRWGNLTCEYPDVGGELIYEASIGDGLTGRFENNEQKRCHLSTIADKILEKINS